ncbi:TerB family tellurite resistance protein [Peribacillus kribbensis]|uniref:TerB family tellurite resistance protein n=1 Tax=Peribacillus kribbensis TaxID=356658 RepID=UPI0003F63DC0|nr:TerB family tellurite resistance protein [Peribacillus kribbensis]
MFLAELQQEEKYAFLELAVLMANIDGNVSFYEGAILNKYKKEMGLEDYQIKGLPIDDILQQFQSERSRNIVLTELFQLIYSDGVFHEKERESVRVIKEHFGFGKGEFENFKDWIEKIKDLSL